MRRLSEHRHRQVSVTPGVMAPSTLSLAQMSDAEYSGGMIHQVLKCAAFTVLSHAAVDPGCPICCFP